MLEKAAHFQRLLNEYDEWPINPKRQQAAIAAFLMGTISNACFMDQRTVLELNAKEARKYLLQSSSYCTVNLPDYYDFTNVLSFVSQKLGNRTLESCLAQRKKMPSEYEGVNHHLLTNKDGKYAFRRLQLANPYLYYLLVKTITEPNNWALIQQHFVNRNRPTIGVASLPKVKKSRSQAQAGVDIPAWWENYEQESIALALQYQYVFVTDITDCYGSIYTHTIPWSLYGKDYAKTHRSEKNLGNDIDRYMCAMNYDQTNGIPQGSVLFDLIAEIVLAYADFCLYERLGAKDINDEDYHILRYRDDYRIFANTKEKLEVIVQTLQEVLIDLNFRMNTSKTHLSEEVILDSIKKDKLAYLTQPPIYDGKDSNFSTIQKELLFILQFAKEHPNSGMVARLLSKLLNRIEDDGMEKDNPRVLISITVETMMTSPRVFNVGTALISCFLSKIEEGKEEILRSVYSKLRRLSNTGELDIWLQRITYHLNDVNIAYDEGLTKVVAGQPGVSLWNNEWVKPELLQGFPLMSICDVQKRNDQTPIIPAAEVSIFEY